MHRAVIVLVLCGCGRIDFDPLGLPDAPFACPATYASIGAGCYRFVTGGIDDRAWPDAEQVCEADAPGAHLMVVDDAAELVVAQAGLAGTANAWIGISDRITEGSYLTVTGRPAFVVWDTGQPAGQDCVQILAATTMADRDCTNVNDYLCEYDAVPAVATAF